MKQNRTLINLIATAVAFVSSVLINFMLTPFIVRHIGVEAYGFVAMANDFVAYISIAAMAINSMSGRFIAIAMHQERLAEAKAYYASTVIANLVLSIVLLAISMPIIACLDSFIQISAHLLTDVKLLFLFSILNFFITIIFSAYAIGYIICNKLYLSSMVQIKASLLRLSLLVFLYLTQTPHVAYMGIAALGSTMLTKLYDVYYQRRLVPELAFSWGRFQWQKCLTMIRAGIWSSITRLGNILSGNLDLLLVNVLLSNTEMGILAIVKIVPNFLTTITGTMAGVYMPVFLELYAKEDFAAMTKAIMTAMKVFAIVLSVPLVILLGMGDKFFSLWLPNQDASQLYILSIFSLLAIIVIGPVAMLHNIFTVVNRLKVNSLLVISTGFLNTVGGVAILSYTDWGIYGIVLLTASLSLVRNLLYTVPFGARYIKQPMWTFFPLLLKACLCVIGVSYCAHELMRGMVVEGWGEFALLSLLTVMAVITCQMLVVFSKQERLDMLSGVKNKYLSLKKKGFCK